MAIKTILVHISAGGHSDERLETAVALARDHEARLVGLFVTPVLDIPAFAQVHIGKEIIQAHRDDAEAAVDRAEAAFRERLAKDDIAAEWHSELGDDHRVVPQHARYADIAVIGQASGLGGEGSLFSQLSEAVVLDSGRPTILVPVKGTHRAIGKRVVVAWNGVREAARAVFDALPILVKADQVTVLVIDAHEQDQLHGAAIVARLARHGVTVEVVGVESGVAGISGALLHWCATNAADLLVMGAYGHARAREWAIGGATRETLDEMNLPVLMSH